MEATTNEEEKKNKFNAEDYEIGYHETGSVMVMTIPLKKWSTDQNYGDIFVSGFFEKAKRIALKNIELMRQEAKAKSLSVPAGVIPMPGVRRAN